MDSFLIHFSQKMFYLPDHDNPEEYNDPVDEQKHQNSESKNHSYGDTVQDIRKELI